MGQSRLTTTSPLIYGSLEVDGKTSDTGRPEEGTRREWVPTERWDVVQGNRSLPFPKSVERGSDNLHQPIRETDRYGKDR